MEIARLAIDYIHVVHIDQNSDKFIDISKQQLLRGTVASRK